MLSVSSSPSSTCSSLSSSPSTCWYIMRVRVVSICFWDSPLKHVIQRQAQVTATAVITNRDQTTSPSCQWRGRWSLSFLSALQRVLWVPLGDAAIWESIVRKKGTGKKSSTHFNCSAMPCSCNLSNKHFYLLLPNRKEKIQSLKLLDF